MRTFDPRKPAHLTGPARPAAPGRTHSGGSREETSIPAAGGPGHDFSRIPVNAPGTLADWLPQARGTGAEGAEVLPASDVADRDGANAVTLGREVHLSSSLPGLPPAEQQRILAHEAVHVAQHSAPGPSAPRERLELEAHQLGPQLLSGQPVMPRFHADARMALADDGGPLPNDLLAVRKAKERRAVLQRWKAVYEGSKGADLAAERRNVLARRVRLDDSMAARLKQSEQFTGQKAREVEEYRAEEERLLAGLNRKPFTVEVTPAAVRIWVRFQVRFEGLADKEAATRFPLLKRNFEKGVRDVWNQELNGSVLPGRRFEVIPHLDLVSATARRDENFWLVTVRPADTGPMAYEKTKLGDPPDGIPTSVTSPLLDKGVMSIPPSHIGKPEILGHETLHLFGLVDRYVIVSGLGAFRLRETRGREDPLGADEEGEVKGKILEEDLGFLLDQLGVYPEISYQQVLTELEKVEEIIRTGRDPNSLIRKRKDFVDRTIKTAEDLP